MQPAKVTRILTALGALTPSSFVLATNFERGPVACGALQRGDQRPRQHGFE